MIRVSDALDGPHHRSDRYEERRRGRQEVILFVGIVVCLGLIVLSIWAKPARAGLIPVRTEQVSVETRFDTNLDTGGGVFITLPETIVELSFSLDITEDQRAIAYNLQRSLGPITRWSVDFANISQRSTVVFDGINLTLPNRQIDENGRVQNLLNVRLPLDYKAERLINGRVTETLLENRYVGLQYFVSVNCDEILCVPDIVGGWKIFNPDPDTRPPLPGLLMVNAARVSEPATAVLLGLALSALAWSRS